MSSLSLLPSQIEMGARVRLRGPCLSPHRGGRRSLAVREASALGRILGVGLYVLRRRRGPPGGGRFCRPSLCSASKVGVVTFRDPASHSAGRAHQSAPFF
jgi:hypothetical protein